MPELILPLAILDSVLPVVVVILGIGLLIFIHELGHFAVAKWNKVRVEAFSLGFGPVLWSFRKGDTDYRLSAIPLGGYVKMAGETPSDEKSDDPAEFQNKGLLARAAILVAGVVMNALLAIVLFVVAFNLGVPLEPPVAGSVQPGSAAWKAGILPGDRVKRVGDTDVVDFIDLIQEIAFAPGPVDVLIERDGKEILLEGVEPVKNRSFGIQEIGIRKLRRREVQVAPDSPAAKAGIQSGDEILTIAGADATDELAVIRATANYAGALPLVFLRDGERKEVQLDPKRTPEGSPKLGVGLVVRGIAGVKSNTPAAKTGFRADDTIVRVNAGTVHSFPDALDHAKSASPEAVTFVVRRGSGEVVLSPVKIATPADWEVFFHDLQPKAGNVNSTEISPCTPDLWFADGNPSRAAGLPEGARILAVGGKEVETFADIQDAVTSAPEDEPLAISWVLGDGPTQKLSVIRRRMVSRYVGFTWQWATETIRIEGIGASVSAGLRRSIYTAGSVLRMIGGIFTGRVSAKNLGGPIVIVQVSYSSAKRNFVHFLYFLGILSVNLAILNILPIPVLDGGHLLFILIEAIRRKPLPERAMGVFQWVGFLFIIMLMLFVIVNDVGRLLG